MEKEKHERPFPFDCMNYTDPKAWENCRELLCYYTDVMQGMKTELQKTVIISSIISVLCDVCDNFPEQITSATVAKAVELVSDALQFAESEYWRSESDSNRLRDLFDLLLTRIVNGKAATENKRKWSL